MQRRPPRVRGSDVGARFSRVVVRRLEGRRPFPAESGRRAILALCGCSAEWRAIGVAGSTRRGTGDMHRPWSPALPYARASQGAGGG